MVREQSRDLSTLNELSSTAKGMVVEKIDQFLSTFGKIKGETCGGRLGKDKEIIEGSSEIPEISKAFKAIADHKLHSLFSVFCCRLITNL